MRKTIFDGEFRDGVRMYRKTGHFDPIQDILGYIAQRRAK
jgi:hypothetical protein